MLLKSLLHTDHLTTNSWDSLDCMQQNPAPNYYKSSHLTTFVQSIFYSNNVIVSRIYLFLCLPHAAVTAAKQQPQFVRNLIKQKRNTSLRKRTGHGIFIKYIAEIQKTKSNYCPEYSLISSSDSDFCDRDPLRSKHIL